MKILALDLGKDKAVACDYRSDSAEHRSLTVRTAPAERRAVIAKRRPGRVVPEAGPAAGGVADLIAALGHDAQRAKTTHPAWHGSDPTRKDDRADARRWAPLSARDPRPQVSLPKGEVRPWRVPIRSRHPLIRRRTESKDPRRSRRGRDGRARPDGRRGRISRPGEGRRRARLGAVGGIGRRPHGWLRAVDARVRRGRPTRATRALVAVARRRRIRGGAMVRDPRPWRRPDPSRRDESLEGRPSRPDRPRMPPTPSAPGSAGRG
jgi:hypothetical protein